MWLCAPTLTYYNNSSRVIRSPVWFLPRMLVEWRHLYLSAAVSASVLVYTRFSVCVCVRARHIPTKLCGITSSLGYCVTTRTWRKHPVILRLASGVACAIEEFQRCISPSLKKLRVGGLRTATTVTGVQRLRKTSCQ